MTTKEIITNLGPGRTVFLIKDAEISAWELLCKHPKYPNIYYLAKHQSVDTTMTLKLDSRESLHWEVDYDAAKEVMWNQLMRKVQAINWSFMDDKRNFNSKLMVFLIFIGVLLSPFLTIWLVEKIITMINLRSNFFTCVDSTLVGIVV